MKKVLHIIDGLKSGGAETFIMNTYRSIDKNDIQFDFLLRNKENNVYIDEVKKYGGKIYYLPSFPKELLKNIRSLKKFFKNNKEYDIVHIHANSLVYFFPIMYASRYGVKKIIIHSHNTCAYNKLSSLIHKMVRKYVYNHTTEHIACSEQAGKWMFNDKPYVIIPNSIDMKKYSYSIENKEKIRKELNIEDKYIIGNIGRFVEQKNHIFLIKVFKEITAVREDAILVLVGDGPLIKNIKELVCELRIEDKVIFTGNRKDIPSVLSSFDVMAFPSLFEGLPFTIIEAQAAGLRCFISSNISDEVVCNSNIYKLSIDDKQLWINALIKDSIYDRVKSAETICNSKYNINNSINTIIELYNR